MKHRHTLLLLLVLAAWVAACKTPSLIESYSTQFGLMHFVKSVEFESKTNGSVEFDFTYRDNDTMMTICNFTIQSDSPEIYALKQAYFARTNTTLALDSLKLMFATRSEHSARYTSFMTKDAFRTLFTGGDVDFVVQGKSQSLKYEGRESFRKNARAVRLDVLNLP
ncbi:MAG: hypothetical protein SNJ66_14900 [Chloroherpetonaceae bacterium]